MRRYSKFITEKQCFSKTLLGLVGYAVLFFNHTMHMKKHDNHIRSKTNTSRIILRVITITLGTSFIRISHFNEWACLISRLIPGNTFLSFLWFSSYFSNKMTTKTVSFAITQGYKIFRIIEMLAAKRPAKVEEYIGPFKSKFGNWLAVSD